MRKLLVLLAMASFLLAVATDGWSSGWREVYKDEVSIVYYNCERIETSGQSKIFYTKTEWTTTTLLFYTGEYFISKMELNCSKKTIRPLERQYFDVNGVPGTKENSQNMIILKPSDFQGHKIDDGTVFWFNLICEEGKMR
jgi:hypothetical protein